MRKEYLPKLIYKIVDLVDKVFLKVCPIFYMSLTRAQDSNDRFIFGLNIIKNLSNKLNSIDVLDVGCGSGNFYIYLNSYFKNMNYLGIDFNINQIKSSKIKKKNFKIINQDLREKWFFKKFDFVWSSEVIEHILDDNNFFENLVRSTKSGGYIIITSPHLDSYIHFADKFSWSKKTSPIEDGGHVKLGYSVDEIKNFSKNFNLNLKEIYFITECDDYRAKNIASFNAGLRCYIFNILYLIRYYKYKKYMSLSKCDDRLRYYCIGAIFQKS